jgi:hypothetical protein
MAKPTHPAPREPGALSLLGLSTLCAAAAATLLLTGHPAGGGAVALAGAIAQWMARSAATFRASLALGATGPLGDAAVLAPLAWVHRFDQEEVAVLALVTLAAALLASYERARSASLGYRTRRSAWLRLTRQVLPALAVIAGGRWLPGLLWATLALAGLTVVVRAANVVLQERSSLALGGPA